MTRTHISLGLQSGMATLESILEAACEIKHLLTFKPPEIPLLRFTWRDKTCPTKMFYMIV